jgi:hypothetical protein
MCKKGSRDRFDNEQAAWKALSRRKRNILFVGPPGGVPSLIKYLSALSLIPSHQAFWDLHGLAVPMILETSYQPYTLTVNKTEFQTQ